MNVWIKLYKSALIFQFDIPLLQSLVPVHSGIEKKKLVVIYKKYLEIGKFYCCKTLSVEQNQAQSLTQDRVFTY